MADTEETGIKSYCPQCKVFDSRNGDYCSECGGELMISPPLPKCPKCGHEVRTHDRYCKNCGTILEVKSEIP